MLDKQKDARAKDFLTSNRKDERKGQERGARRCKRGDEALVEKGHEDKHDDDEGNNGQQTVQYVDLKIGQCAVCIVLILREIFLPPDPRHACWKRWTCVRDQIQ